MNFWKDLKKPFFVLAPMDDVTDVVFRNIVLKAARPDVFFTEFTNCDGLFSAGRDHLMPRLKFTPGEHPVVAQIWGKDPENFYKTAQLVKELGFDGIDINMGCPASKVLKNGTCSALIENRPLAKAQIEATIKGAEGLPVSVKTRIGIREIITEDWVSFLLQFPLSALTIHGRTSREMSKVPAHWDEIKKAVEVKNKLRPDVVLIGNGDVKSYQDGIEKAKESGVDGVMIGRGIFEDIWVFEKEPHTHLERVEERKKLLLDHAHLFESTFGRNKNFNIMKKFAKAYLRDFDGASELRILLMNAKSVKEWEQILKVSSI